MFFLYFSSCRWWIKGVLTWIETRSVSHLMQTEVSYRLIDKEGFVLWKPVGRFVFLSKGLAAISIEGYKSEKQSYKIVWIAWLVSHVFGVAMLHNEHACEFFDSSGPIYKKWRAIKKLNNRTWTVIKEIWLFNWQDEFFGPPTIAYELFHHNAN